MAANHMMIHDGVGVFVLPPQHMESTFRTELICWYETGDYARFGSWLDYHAVGLLENDGRTQAQIDGVDD